MKRSKHGLFVFPPKKTLIWRRHCSIGQSCCSMTSKRSIDWFLESSRAWSVFTRAKSYARLYPFDKPIKSLYLRSFVVSVLFARFHFKVIRKSLCKRSKRHCTIPTPQHTSGPTVVCATSGNIRFLAQTFAAAKIREKNFFPVSRKMLVPAEVGEESWNYPFRPPKDFMKPTSSSGQNYSVAEQICYPPCYVRNTNVPKSVKC